MVRPCTSFFLKKQPTSSRAVEVAYLLGWECNVWSLFFLYGINFNVMAMGKNRQSFPGDFFECAFQGDSNRLLLCIDIKSQVMFTSKWFFTIDHLKPCVETSRHFFEICEKAVHQGSVRFSPLISLVSVKKRCFLQIGSWTSTSWACYLATLLLVWMLWDYEFCGPIS